MLAAAAASAVLDPAGEKAPAHVKPVGITNTGNFCYMAAVLQCLYWVPEVRSHVLRPIGGFHTDAVHLAMGSFFSRMQTTGATCVSAGIELLPTIESRHGDIVSPGNVDDADAFLRLLSKGALAGLPPAVLGVEKQLWLLAPVPGRRDVAVLFAPQTLREPAGLQVNALDADGQAVHALATQGAAVRYTYRPGEHVDDRGYDLLDGRGRRVGVQGLGADATLSEALALLGVRRDTVLECRQVVRLSHPLPGTLVLSASKFAWDRRRNNALWNTQVVTRFEPEISVKAYAPDDPFVVDPVELLHAGITEHVGDAPAGHRDTGTDVQYVLHAVVFFIPEATHYVAAVCTDASKNTWHLFNDEHVTELAGPPAQSPQSGHILLRERTTRRRIQGASKRQPYLFFYARRNVRDAWAAGGLSRALQPAALACDVMAQAFTAMRNIRGAISRLVDFPQMAALALAGPLDDAPPKRRPSRRRSRSIRQAASSYSSSSSE